MNEIKVVNLALARFERRWQKNRDRKLFKRILDIAVWVFLGYCIGALVYGF